MISPISLARGPNSREEAPGLPLNMRCHKGDGRSDILLFSGLWLSSESTIKLPLGVLLKLLCDIVFQQNWGKGK